MKQVNKKTLAQNILKNQKFIAKYKTLDAQLQNTNFQYNYLDIKVTIDGNNGSDVECNEWNG